MNEKFGEEFIVVDDDSVIQQEGKYPVPDIPDWLLKRQPAPFERMRKNP